jgi:predicted permease
MWQRIRALFGRQQLDQDLRDELEAHIAHKQLSLERQGIPSLEAHRLARLALGNTSSTTEDVRQQWTFPIFESILQDLSYGLRLLRKDFAFTAIILFTLALSIGANTTVFQLLSALLWQPLPVSQPQELVRIRAINLPPTDKAWANGRSVKPTERLQVPYPLYRLLADRKDLFANIAGISGQGNFALDLGTSSQPVRTSVVTGSYFPVLGIKPAAGRLLQASDDIQGGPPEGWGIVISHRLWVRLFGQSPTAIGKRVLVERVPYQILGVAPQSFSGVHPGVEVDLYLPLSSFEAMFPEWNWRTNNSQWTIQSLARLKPGMPLAKTNAILHNISKDLLQEVRDPQLSDEALEHHKAILLDAAAAGNGFSYIVNNYSPILWLLLGAAFVVLLLAVTNLASLMLARTSARHHEMATRLALGASPSRLRRQLLLETLLLSLGGLMLGIIFSQWATQALLVANSTDESAVTLQTNLSWKALAFLSGLVLTIMGIAGWLPATSAVSSVTRHSTAPRSDTKLRSTLVVVQFAMTLTLIGGASLMLLSLRSLTREPIGLRLEQLLYFTPDLINAQVAKARMPQIYAQLLEEIRQQPGVQAAAWTQNIPLGGSLQASPLEIQNQRPGNNLTMVHNVTDGYFKAMAVPLLAGQDFPGFSSATKDVAIVSEGLARRYFGSSSAALNQRLRIGQRNWLTVIGVVADTKYSHVRDAASPTLYIRSWDSKTIAGMSLVIYHAGPPNPVREAVDTLLTRQVGRRPFLTVKTPEEILWYLLVKDRVLTLLLSLFAFFALLISATGIAGLIGYVVQLRRKEIGIRLAVGATPRLIRHQFLRFALGLTLPGLAIGAALSFALRHSLKSFLFAAEPSNPWVWVVAATLLLSAALLAAALPAARAASLDPQQVLRSD